MTKAEELDFNLNDQPIKFLGRSHMSGTEVQLDIEEGNSVTLKKGDVKVHVKNVTRNSDNSYLGEIYYIKSEKKLSERLAIEDINVGSEITFLYDHVFECQY
jgi:hypothetical protein